MAELEYNPEIVGRIKELRELKKYLEKANKGQGSALFISGEAGIGKTKLVNELMNAATSKGFRILYGESMFESLTPYMPFLEALRSGGLDHLFAEEIPKVEAAFLITDTGLLIKEVLRDKTGLDPDIFASMLTTVSDFVKDSLSMLSGEKGEGALSVLGYEKYRILMESVNGVNLAVILTGRENEFLINDMREILTSVKTKYGSVLRDWDGADKNVAGIETLLEPLIKSGKFNGVLHGEPDPKTRRNLLFENVSMGLLREAIKKPVILCIEDLQWADPSSLALMHYVARAAKNSGIVVVGTYRSEDVVGRRGRDEPGLKEILRSMTREELLEVLDLDRLDRDRTYELLSSLLGEYEFPEEFKANLYEETEGNPLFIIELMKLLVAEGHILRKDEGWRLAETAKELEIPSKVYDVIIGRLERLGSEHRRVLDYASVLGDEFNPSLLASVLNRDMVAVLEALRDLERDHRLVHCSGDRCEFDHTKTKEVLYSEIPEMLRREYHCLMAERIEDLHRDDVESVVDELAYHYYSCRDRENGLKYLLMAAEKARGEFAIVEGMNHLREALELLGEKGYVNERLDILSSLSELSILHGDLDECLEHSNRILELGEEAEANGKMARAHHNIGLVLKRRNEWDKAILSLERAVGLAGETGDMRGKAESHLDLGYVYERKGEYENARKEFEKAKKAATEANDAKILGTIYEAFGALSDIQGDHESAIYQFRKSLEILQGAGDLFKIAAVYGDLGVTSFLKGDIDGSIDYNEKSIELSKRIGDIRGLGYGLVNAAEAYMEKTELERAVEYLDKALKIFERLNEKMMVAAVLRNYGVAYRKKGDWGKSAERFLSALDIYEKQVDAPYYQAYTYFNLGLMYKEKSDELYKRLGMEKDLEKVKKEIEEI
jgi:predicted ATPase